MNRTDFPAGYRFIPAFSLSGRESAGTRRPGELRELVFRQIEPDFGGLSADILLVHPAHPLAASCRDGD